MEYQVVIQRKNMKGISIKIKKNGKVVVSAPTNISDELIEKVLEKKASWIAEKLNEMKAREKHIPQFVDGGNIWFIGKPYIIRVSDGEKDEVSLSDKELLVKVTNRETERIKHIVVEWLKKQAERVIKEKTEKFAELLGVKPESIELKELKGAWGLCKTKTGDIEFNWKLIYLPEKLINYVVVHELAHLKHPNHNRSFWSFVTRALPDCKQRHREIRKWSGL